MSDSANSQQNTHDHRDTIVAPATALVRAAVAIVRISGSKAHQIAATITNKQLQHQQATPTRFHREDALLDFGVAIYFAAPHSLTGEDVIELQCHGAVVIVEKLIDEICHLGARLARPGEFLERAFLHDKLDLIQAEAVADLINSQTLAQAQACTSSMEGAYSRELHTLRDTLIELRVACESHIDFSDQDIQFHDTEVLETQLTSLYNTTEALLERTQSGVRVQQKKQVVLVGEPNVGKSSLFNCLCHSDRAIVTHVAGTTRDLLFTDIVVDTVPVTLIDTAGLHDKTDDIIEQIGIHRSLDTMYSASLLLWVFEAGDDIHETHHKMQQFTPQDASDSLLFIANKCDKIAQEARQESIALNGVEYTVIYISTLEQQGLDLVKRAIANRLHERVEAHGFSANYRHLQAIKLAHAHLGCAQSACTHIDIVAQEVRLAQQALEEMLGMYDNEALLGDIFSRFCIGK